jgi:hypothetical protein
VHSIALTSMENFSCTLMHFCSVRKRHQELVFQIHVPHVLESNMGRFDSSFPLHVRFFVSSMLYIFIMVTFLLSCHFVTLLILECCAVRSPFLAYLSQLPELFLCSVPKH